MTDTEPGAIEIDRSGSEPLVSIRHPPGPYTLDQVRAYASFLTVLADENAGKHEPEVEELIAVLGATRARYLQWDAAAPELARACPRCPRCRVQAACSLPRASRT